MYAVTSMLLVSRTRATLRSAEFGFFGVEVKTRTHTPRFWGEPWSAGRSASYLSFSRRTRTSGLTVGNHPPEAKTPRPGHRVHCNLSSLCESPEGCQGLKSEGLGAGAGVGQRTAPGDGGHCGHPAR